jgi:hypothetical protein
MAPSCCSSRRRLPAFLDDKKRRVRERGERSVHGSREGGRATVFDAAETAVVGDGRRRRAENAVCSPGGYEQPWR